MAVGGAAAGLALLLCLGAMVLQIVVCFSAPTSDMISFLDVTLDEQTTHFGVFGYTGSRTSVGYYFEGFFTDHPQILHDFSAVLVLHPIVATLLFLALSSGLYALLTARPRPLTVSTLLTAFASVLSVVLWIVDMLLFGIVRNNYRDQGAHAEYGNAAWIALAAMALVVGSALAGGVAMVQRRRTSKEGYSRY